MTRAELATLHEDSFRGLEQLKLLAMRHLSAPVSTCQQLNSLNKSLFLTQQFDIQSVSPIGIDQGDNQLTELSAAMMRHLPLLEQLLLGGKLDKQNRVIVKGNRITELGAIFGHNEQLQVIDFSQNRLQKIDPATFAGLKKLRWLSLGHNKLTTIPAGTFQGLEQLQTSGVEQVDDNSCGNIPRP